MILAFMAAPGFAAALRDQAPVISQSSTRSTQQIAACLSETMGRSGGAVVSTNMLESGMSVTASASTMAGIRPFVTAEIREEGELRRVEVRVRGKRPKKPRTTYSNLVNCL